MEAYEGARDADKSVRDVANAGRAGCLPSDPATPVSIERKPNNDPDYENDDQVHQCCREDGHLRLPECHGAT
jgi:hypothetical protein